MKSVLLSLIVLCIASGCATSGPITATSNKVGIARGVSCRSNLLFIIPLSTDASIHAAALNGRIDRISTVDYNSFYSIIFNSNCTVVHGFRHKTQEEIDLKKSKVEEATKVDKK